MSDTIKVGDYVRTGTYVLGEWRPSYLGEVVSVSDDGTVAQVDVMGIHGGRPWIRFEETRQLRKEPGQ